LASRNSARHCPGRKSPRRFADVCHVFWDSVNADLSCDGIKAILMPHTQIDEINTQITEKQCFTKQNVITDQ